MYIQVERLRVYGLVDVLPRAAFAINTPINSAYMSVLVKLTGDDCSSCDCSSCSW